ncbi:aldo/keto reductase [Persephonella sp.]
MLYKKFLDYKLSEIGIGTYLGKSDDQTDKNYLETITEGLEKGITVIDTALNYRNMRSEKVIGEVLKSFNRKDVVISTKGGYLSVPYNLEEDPTQWFKREFVKSGLVNPKDITDTGNLITKNYIEWAFNQSINNLSTDYIDVYFLHNPEDQLLKFDRETFYKKLRDIFTLLEEKVTEGKLKYYGIATWNGLRVSPDNIQYLSLNDILNIARDIAGDDHHFKFIQLPFNIAMIEGYNLKNQILNGKEVSTFEFAEENGIYTYISSPLMQRRLIRPLHIEVLKKFKVEKFAHAPLQFVRSCKGVGTMLIGMSKKEHLLENLEIENYPKLDKSEIDEFINSRSI